MSTKNDKRYAEIGGRHRAESRYYMILYRINHTDEPKNFCYVGIKNVNKQRRVYPMVHGT